MAKQQDPLRSIYNDLGLEKAGVGYDKFNDKFMSDSNARRAVYTDLGLEQAGIDYNTFESRLGVKKKEDSGQDSASGAQTSTAPLRTFQAPDVPEITSSYGSNIVLDKPFEGKGIEGYLDEGGGLQAEGPIQSTYGRNLLEPETFGDMASRATPQPTQVSPEKQSKWADFVDSMERGSVSVGTMLAGLPEFLYEQTGLGDYEQAIAALGPMSGLTALNQVKDFYAARNQELSNRITKYEDDIVDSALKGNFIDAGAQLFNAIGESIAPMLLMATTGSIGGAGAGSLSYAGSALPQSAGRLIAQEAIRDAPRVAATAIPFASSKWQEIKDDPNIPAGLKPLVAYGSGLSEIIYEGSFGTGKLMRQVADKAIGKKGINRIVKGFFDKALESNGIPASAFKGSVSEMSTDLTNNLIDIYSGVDPDRDPYQGLANAAVVGAVMDAGISTPTHISGMIANRAEAKEALSLSEANEGILGDLMNPELNFTPEQRKELTDRYNKNTEKIDAYVRNSAVQQSKLTPRQRELQQRLLNRRKVLDEIINNEALSEATRQESEAELSEVDKQIDAISPNKKEAYEIDVDNLPDDVREQIDEKNIRIQNINIEKKRLEEQGITQSDYIGQLNEEQNRLYDEINNLAQSVKQPVVDVEANRKRIKKITDDLNKERAERTLTPEREKILVDERNRLIAEIDSVQETPTDETITETVEETPTEPVEATDTATEGVVESPIEEQVTESTTQTQPEEGDTISLPPRVEGGPNQNFEFNEGKWKQRVGRELVEISPSQQTRINDEFLSNQQTAETTGQTNLQGQPTTDPSQAVQVSDEANPQRAAQTLQDSYNRLTEGMTPEQIDSDPELVRMRDRIGQLSGTQKNVTPSETTTEQTDIDTTVEPVAETTTEQTQEDVSEIEEPAYLKPAELKEGQEIIQGDLPKKIPSKKDKINTDDLSGQVAVKPIETKPKKITEKDALSSVTASDEMRPALNGVYYDAENKVMVSTDAHGMVIIPNENIKKSRIENPKTGATIDAKYPDYRAVIPKNPNVSVSDNIDGIINSLSGLERANKFVTKPINGIIRYGDKIIGVNASIANKVLKALRDTGTKDFRFELPDTPNRAIVVRDNSNPDKMGLIMPIMLSGEGGIAVSEVGRFDIDTDLSATARIDNIRAEIAEKESTESWSEKYHREKLEEGLDSEYHKEELDKAQKERQKEVSDLKEQLKNLESQQTQEETSNAISQRKAEKIPLGEPSSDSESVVGEIREQTAAQEGTQGQTQGQVDEATETTQPEAPKKPAAEKPTAKAGDNLRSLAEKIRQAKINKPSDLRNLRSSTLFDVAWDGALETAATALEATGNIADAIQAGINHLKQTEWYKSLSDDGKKKAEAAVRDTIEGPEEKTPKPNEKKKTRLQEVGEASRAKEMPNSPKGPLPVPVNPGSFLESAHKDISNNEVRETLSNVQRESSRELTREEKEYRATSIKDALHFGTQVVENAKFEFGDSYVGDILQTLSDNASTIPISNRSLITIALEIDLERQLQANPKDITAKKQLDMVRRFSIEQQRQAAIATGYGRLRQIARVGYDLSLITDEFFSSAEKSSRNRLVQAVESDMDAINKEAEAIEAESYADADAIEAAVMEEVGKQVDAIYERLPSARRKAADKAIAALDNFQKKIRAKAYSDVTGMVAIIDSGITTIKAAIKAGVAVADAIEIGINKINEKLKGKKWKESEFRKDMMDGFRSEGIDTESGTRVNKKKPKTPEEKLADAKKRIRERIAERQKTIDEKKVELKALKKPFNEDAEYLSLVEKEKELKKLQEQYLTPESKALLEERKRKAIISKVESDIASLDRQIAKGEKDARDNKPTKTDSEIEAMKAQRAAKAEFLEQLDPNPKSFAKQALIDAGYSRTINVKGEAREVIDWKKLAGAEGSIENIERIVEQALIDSGFNEGQIARMRESFKQEYNDIRASIIEKSLSELNRLNKQPVSSQKSSAQRLAELYNLGMFDAGHDTYDYLLNKSVGLDGLTQEQFFEAKRLAAALSDLYRMSGGNEFLIKHAVRNINHQISQLLNKVAWNQSNGFFKATQIVGEFLNLNLRNKLQTIKQLLENPISAWQETIIQWVGDMATKTPTDKSLAKQRKELAKTVSADIVISKGLYYGEVNTPFLSKSKAEEWLANQSDSKLYQMALSMALGKSYLEGADSMFKAELTEKYFVHNLISILTDKKNPNRMTKDKAMQFISEQRTGQKFEEALEQAGKIIQDTNRKHGKEILADNGTNRYRVAMDLVNANLLTGDAMTMDMVQAAYNAAYKTAGHGLGHEANNYISKNVSLMQSRIESITKQAIKDKKWNAAGWYTLYGTLYRNILNPFVGGGTNWAVLGLQKMGVDLISPIHFLIERGRKNFDISTPDGMKNLEDKLFVDRTSKTVNARVLIGALTSWLVSGIALGAGWDDDYYDWLEKNKWAKKYAPVFTPALFGLIVQWRHGKMSEWFNDTFNRGAQFDATDNIIKAMIQAESGSPYGKDALIGQVGYELGTNLSVPVIPWRMMRDIGGIYDGITGNPKRSYDFKNVGFWNGYFNYGMIDYLGFRPDATYKRNAANYIPDSDKETLSLIKDRQINTDSESNKEVAIRGAVRYLNHDEAKKYDDTFAKSLYRILKDNNALISGLPDSKVKDFVSDARFLARRQAQASVGGYDPSISEVTVDGVRYILPPDAIRYRLRLIERYKKENRDRLNNYIYRNREQGLGKEWSKIKAERDYETRAREYSRDLTIDKYKKQLIEKR